MEQINESENLVTKKVTYTGVKKSKILVARLIDFCMLVILSIVTVLTALFITVVTPKFKGILNRAEEIQLNSKLYEKDKNGDAFLLTQILDSNEEMKTDEKNERLDAALTFFFSSEDFFNENDGKEFYTKLKSEAKSDNKNLFKLDGENYVINVEAGLTPSVYYKFYKDALNLHAFGYLQNNSEYHGLSQTVSKIFIIESVTMPIISYLILYFFVPLFSFKNHSTLGFKTFRIGIIDANATSISTKKALGALTFSCFVVGLLSLVTFFIPMMISIGFFTYREDNKNLTGYLFNYYFVDVSHQQIYENTDLLINDEEKIEKNTELFSNTPLEIENKEKNDI